MFGRSWSGDIFAAFSESPCWSSFPYFTWMLSQAFEWSPMNTKENQRNWPATKCCLKCKANGYLFQLAINEKQCIFCAQSLGLRFFVMMRVIASLSCGIQSTVAPSPSVFWQHYSDELCIAVWVMFTDQSRSVKSRIIALQNSPGIVFWSTKVKQEVSEADISKNKCSFYFSSDNFDVIANKWIRKYSGGTSVKKLSLGTPALYPAAFLETGAKQTCQGHSVYFQHGACTKNEEQRVEITVWRHWWQADNPTKMASPALFTARGWGSIIAIQSCTHSVILKAAMFPPFPHVTQIVSCSLEWLNKNQKANKFSRDRENTGVRYFVVVPACKTF